VSDTFGEQWSRQLREWLELAGQKTEEVARVSKRQLELLQLDWDLLRRRADLAERFLHLVDQGEFSEWSKDPHLAELVEAVRGLEGQQRAKRKEIEDIRGSGSRTTGS
jgi:hypothetical protein